MVRKTSAVNAQSNAANLSGLFHDVSGQHLLVAQICNLPFRRFVIGKGPESSSALKLSRVPQNAILRYSRLQICATLNTYYFINRPLKFAHTSQT
jgi:hypothetical protein